MASDLSHAVHKADLVAHWRRRYVMMSVSSQGDACKLPPGAQVPVFTGAQKKPMKLGPLKLYAGLSLDSVTSEHDLSAMLGPTRGWALSHASLYDGLTGLIIFQGTGLFLSQFWIHPPISIASSPSKDIA